MHVCTQNFRIDLSRAYIISSKIGPFFFFQSPKDWKIK